MTALGMFASTINTTINDSSTDLLFKTKELHISTAVEL
jgi:hypothetical protein